MLGVSPSASTEEVRTAYQRLVRLHHPDRSSDGSSDSEAFRRVQDAYDALREPEARRRHDAEVRHAAMASAAAQARVLEVELSDLRYGGEDDDDEDDDGGEGTEHGGEEHGGIAAGGCAMWRYDCRCGDEFALREHQLADAIPCRSCSLVLKVVDAASRARAASTS